MSPTSLSVNPVYGAIYKSGEFVQRGAILGLSVDMKEVVVAPVSGWVQLVESALPEKPEPPRVLRVEIWQQPIEPETLPQSSDTCN